MAEHIGGYDVNFIVECSDQLICVICRLVLRDPVSLNGCGHSFCLSCFNQAKKHADQRKEDFSCPTDRTKIDISKVYQNKALCRLVLDLKVRCGHYSDGCHWTGEVRNLQRHLEGDCIIIEHKRSSTSLVQMQKRLGTCEKLLTEKDEMMKSYDMRLEQKEKRLQLCEKGLQEKENRLQLLEKKFNDKDKEYESLLIQLYQKEEEIIVLTGQSRRSTGPLRAAKVPSVDVVKEWDKRKNRRDKDVYMKELCKAKEEDLLITLLESSNDMWGFTYEGMGMLHNAACGDCVKVINYMCNDGRMSLNAQCNIGLCALYYAVKNNKYAALQALIIHGAEVNIRDQQGDTALDLVQGRGGTCQKIRMLLEESGGLQGDYIR